MAPLTKLLVIHSCEKRISIVDVFVLLCAKCKGVCHKVVNHTGVALCVPVGSLEYTVADNAGGGAGGLEFVQNIFFCFVLA